jgi:hypothetical protein
MRSTTKNETAAAAMTRKAGVSSSPVRSTSQVATSGVKPPITPRQML